MVRRIITFGPGSSATVLAEYDANIASGDLPVTVEVQERQPGNYVDRVARLLRVEMNKTIPDETFSISSIGLPVDTMVTDYRNNRIVGYWTGQEISATPGATRTSNDSGGVPGVKTNPMRQWLIVLNIVVGCGVFTWLVFFKKAGKTVSVSQIISAATKQPAE